jgi:hypothetical protein
MKRKKKKKKAKNMRKEKKQMQGYSKFLPTFQPRFRRCRTSGGVIQAGVFFFLLLFSCQDDDMICG